MPLKFGNVTHQVASGTAPQDLLSVFKSSSPYLAKLLRFWVMCSDPVYPAGAMLDLELLRISLAAQGNGGTANPGVLEEDNSLGLAPLSICRQNDTTLTSAGGGAAVIWAGSLQVWQGVDVVVSGKASIIQYSAYGPGYDAFVLRLVTAPLASVKLSAGLIFQEHY